MPEKKTIEKARKDKREGKAPSTQAGEFVHEEIEHVTEGQARSAVDQAGDRDRPFQGAPRRREAAAAEEGDGLRGDPAQSAAATSRRERKGRRRPFRAPARRRRARR